MIPGRLAGVVLAVVAAVVAAPGLTAQASTPGGCFPVRPLPTCRSYFVFEVQGAFPVASTTRTATGADGRRRQIDDFETRLEWNLGYMVNLNERTSVGGVVTLGTGGGPDPLTGLRARGRWWASRDVALELEGGLLRTGAAGHRPEGVVGGTVDARLVLHDKGSVFLRWDAPYIDAVDYGVGGESGGLVNGAYFGVALNDRPAVYGTAALGLAYAVLLALFVSTAQ